MILDQYWIALAHGGGKVAEEINAIEVMRYMGGWDWDTYLNQPSWLIEMIKGKMSLENEHQRMESKRTD